MDDYINVPYSSLFGVDNITISAWVLPSSSSSGDDGFIHRGSPSENNGFFTSASTSNIQFSPFFENHGPESLVSESAISLNEWQHIVYIVDNGTVKIYLNGALVGISTSTNGLVLNKNYYDLEIGRTIGYGYQYWHGKVDDMKIYSCALTCSEIEELYNGSNLVSSSIALTYPDNLKILSSTDAQTLTYSIASVPAASEHTVKIQIFPLVTDDQGSLVPDLNERKEIIRNYNASNPLVIGSYDVNIADFFTGPVSGSWFWKVVYSNSASPVIDESPFFKFTLPGGSIAIPMEDHLVNDNLHTNNINWVYQVSYLDNGDTKQSITYLDGLGKVRQSQVLANSVNSGTSSGNVLCQEFVYSENGGTTLQSMVAPCIEIPLGMNHLFLMFMKMHLILTGIL